MFFFFWFIEIEFEWGLRSIEGVRGFVCLMILFSLRLSGCFFIVVDCFCFEGFEDEEVDSYFVCFRLVRFYFSIG